MTALWRQQPVGIVGLGLIGGSLGLDLLSRGATVRALVHRPETAERARQRQLASTISTDPSVLQDCAVVVLALPLDRLLQPGPELLSALPPQAVITDVGSVKQPVQDCWQPLLGGRFVPGHPMAGTAQAGVEAGQTGLFHNRPWVATPSEATDPASLSAVRDLAEAVGARWSCCPAEAHDRAVALISHLPVLVSAALLQTADRCSEGESSLATLVRTLASSGFADTSRVGGGNPELGTLMARCNRAALLPALHAYRDSLQQLISLVEEQRWPELQGQLSDCQALRPDFLSSP
ncbi:MAG: prephenate/arogenate dehydrogenase [Synechococcaceae cyanobacterium]|nr:prephenate/arogenate dehydrogenase [Synechococcaceae cyanobacterium]